MSPPDRLLRPGRFGRFGRSGAGWATLAALALAGCGADPDGGLSGLIEVDGSSTVFPISQAMAEEFQIAGGRAVRVSVGVSGTGGGFQRFCNGETDITNASRQIDEAEAASCRAEGIEPVEVQIARDGLTLVVHPSNDWVACVSVAELRRLWAPGSEVERWSQLRPDWPDEELKLYGPDTDSGTFDYFTAAVVGEEGASRSDYTASADDNVLVGGVSGDPGALGYFGYAYFEDNREQLRAIEVDGGAGCVAPSRETILNGTYTLARPMYIYIRRDALDRPEVGAFVRFFLERAATLIPETGYIPLEPEAYAEIRARIG
ncbi:PstS family phosphate ABC transporter substrate-binding protein [Candidatus Palauibacter sp.]|uniref:PstS family phosphate ABC transporter substrate-binding protein n=1 Tax=Candidatus Palauibacter sp. TaxID=3101350 RepID=UPI003B029E3D